MTFLAIWIVGAALAYWLAERNLDPGQPNQLARLEIAGMSLIAWPVALAIGLLSMLGDDEGDDA